MPGKFENLFKGFFDSEKIGGLLLFFCTVISLSIANSAVGEAYVHWLHQKHPFLISNTPLTFSVEQLVNDALMTIFFLLVGLEVEREIYIGELSDFKKAILPVVAAIGGMLVPSLIHFSLNNNTPTQPGFAIPMATDIAFALAVLALAGKKIPTSVKVFLSALAIIDDIGAIVVIALFYTKTIAFVYLIAAFVIFLALIMLNRLGVKKLPVYLLAGVGMWYCFLQSGVHATLTGVLLAFAIPFDKKDEENVSLHLQSRLHTPVAFIIVPVFALVNTAIIFPSGLGGNSYMSNAIGIIAGLCIGKVIGIVTLPFLLVRAGKAKLQEGITWSRLTGIGFLGGIGFTMSMFICNLAFNDEELIVTSKLSILLGSLVSAVTGLLVLSKAGKRTV